MSNSTNGADEPIFKIQKRSPKMTPAGYDITLSEKQGLEVAELLEHPGWKVLKGVVAHQRKDHIARQALSTSQTNEQLWYFKGQVAELQLFFITMKRLRDAVLKKEQEDKKETEEEV